MHSGKIVNLLELGINTIDDEIVVHPWAQSILDEQWCGRDVRCGKVMFKSVPAFMPLLLQVGEIQGDVGRYREIQGGWVAGCSLMSAAPHP